MIVKTKEAIKIITKGLGIKSLARSTFQSYCGKGLIQGRLNTKLGRREQFSWNKSDIISSIERIREYRLSVKGAQAESGKAKQQRKKKPAEYDLAMSIFNKQVKLI